jgi:hypothetical protein
MNIMQSVTRLAQMHESDVQQLDRLNAQWNTMYNLVRGQLDQSKAGLDDLAVMLGIIEPPSSMPMLPPREETGPRPVFTHTDPDTGAEMMS